MPGTKSPRLAVIATLFFVVFGCSTSADTSASTELPAATQSEAAATPQAPSATETQQQPSVMPGIPGGPSFRPAGDRAAQAEEIRGFLGEIRPLATGCSGSVTIRSLVMYGSGAETQMMRLPPAPRPCEALTAEIRLWESRLASIEAGS